MVLTPLYRKNAQSKRKGVQKWIAKIRESAKNKVKSCKKSIKGVIDQGFFEIVINVTNRSDFLIFNRAVFLYNDLRNGNKNAKGLQPQAGSIYGTGLFQKKREGGRYMTGKREKTAALSKGRQQGGLQKAALYFWKHKYLYLMLLPAILYYIIFCYVPMYGVTIAFKDFNPMLGIWKSPWAGTEMFQKLFGMEKFYSVFWNTIRISLIRLIFGFPFPIIIALLLNELRLGKVKRVIQTAIYIPDLFPGSFWAVF